MTTQSITLRGFTFEVEFSYTKPYYGAREPGTGLALEPDAPESIEINSIILVEAGANLVDLYDLWPKYEDLADSIAEALLQSRKEASDDYAYECWRDKQLEKGE